MPEPIQKFDLKTYNVCVCGSELEHYCADIPEHEPGRKRLGKYGCIRCNPNSQYAHKDLADIVVRANHRIEPLAGSEPVKDSKKRDSRAFMATAAIVAATASMPTLRNR